MKTADFDYELPEDRIAQTPAEPRDSCRLLVLNRSDGSIKHRIFKEIGEFFEPGDLLVANETRVLSARLFGRKDTGAESEILLIRRQKVINQNEALWECLVSPGRRLKPGASIVCSSDDATITATVLDFIPNLRGGRVLHLVVESRQSTSLDEAISRAGKTPLPPYIHGYAGDMELYQTVYSMKDAHSAAAPTAGLHFTPELLCALQEQGVDFATLELEVGIDTFRTVDEENAEDHVMHTERYHLSQNLVDKIHQTKAQGHRLIAVGTTSVRALESAWDTASGDIVPRDASSTNLFLMPGSVFHVVDAMITNFHVPRSTLMMLVSAFADRDTIMRAYAIALKENYRFLSFGDAMLIL